MTLVILFLKINQNKYYLYQNSYPHYFEYQEQTNRHFVIIYKDIVYQ